MDQRVVVLLSLLGLSLWLARAPRPLPVTSRAAAVARRPVCPCGCGWVM